MSEIMLGIARSAVKSSTYPAIPNKGRVKITIRLKKVTHILQNATRELQHLIPIPPLPFPPYILAMHMSNMLKFINSKKQTNKVIK